MPNKTLHRHVVTTLADGSDLAFHVHDLEGTADGPTVGICAAIHGDEPTGTLIAHRIIAEVAHAQFSGRLLILPVANPPAFAVNKRHSPLDDLNLNRLFPGNANGWVSEQLAIAITERFLTKVDALIDLHSGGARATVDYTYIKNAEELSRSFGSRVLYRPDPAKVGTMFPGTSNSVTESRGVPTVTVELGGGSIDQTPYVERGVRGILNMLSCLDVLAAAADPVPEQIVVDRIETIRPRFGGVLVTAAPPLGQPVEGDAILGRVLHPQTFEEIEVIRSPVSEGVMILSHLTTNVVQPGDYAYMVGSSA